MKAIGIIPARYSSTRFPGKPLAMIKGISLIQRVYEKAKACDNLKEIFVATDDNRIFDHVMNFGGKAVMTSREHRTGTDRLREAAGNLDCEIIVNIQGDEPLIDAGDIDNAVYALIDDESLNVSTLIYRLRDLNDLRDANIVKVVVDKNFNALYFSRNFIPYDLKNNPSGNFSIDENLYYKHIGLYVYRKSFLMKFSELPESIPEKMESLEQLRILESGEKIKTILTDNEYIPVDTPEDISKVEMKV
jgi:3-deoxy-manno-octulosonate cytidylyltransferase (CMP-KDO synthetase)